MRCRHCGTQVQLGGEPPGLFLTIAGIGFGLALIGVAGEFLLADDNRFAGWFLAGFGVLVGVFSLCAVCTNVIDNASMGPGGRSLGGRECPSCGIVNRIRPWSW